MQQIQQMLAAVLADVDKSPRQSLARAMALPESLGNRHPRSEALATIAERTNQSNPEVSRGAIDELPKILPNLPPEEATDLGTMAARIAQGLGDRQRTEKMLDAALKAANDLLKEDRDQDDSNQALPAFWPSTRAYARLVGIGEKFSPAWTEKTLHDIPDDGIRAVVMIAYARVLLNIPSTANTSISISKKGTWVMTSVDSEQ